MEVFGPRPLKSMSRDAKSMTSAWSMCPTRTNAKDIHPPGLRWGPSSAFSSHHFLLKQHHFLEEKLYKNWFISFLLCQERLGRQQFHASLFVEESCNGQLTTERTGENLRRVCVLSEETQKALDKNEEAWTLWNSVKILCEGFLRYWGCRLLDVALRRHESGIVLSGFSI